MAKKITVAELDLNTQAFLKAAQQTKIAIDKIVLSQKKLEAQSNTNSQQYIKNQAELKRLNSIFSQQKNAINALQSPYGKLSKELQIARTNAKNLAAEFGVNSARAKTAAASVRQLDDRLKKIDNSVGQNQRSVGKYSEALRGATARFTGAALAASGLLLVITGIFRGIRDAIRRIVQFDKTMTNLSAILNVSRKSIGNLETKIKDVAGASIKTSNEVATLAETLIVLGKTKEEVIKLLKPVNDLSIGLQASSKDAGELLVMTLNAFGAGTDEAVKYADVIAKMRTSTALDFERIRDALGFLAPTAKAAGESIQSTGADLGVLVNNGIRAARAGRLLSTSFLRLAGNGLTLNEALDKINIAQNKNVTSTELLRIAGDLFGKRSAALGLILANNRKHVADLTREFENSKGTLDALTKKQLGSLSAKMTILNSTWEKFILNVENGDGGLARFSKGAITTISRFINLADAVSQSSTGLFDFLGKLTQIATNPIFANQIIFQNELNKAVKENKNLVNELIDLQEKKAKQDGVAFFREAALDQLKNTSIETVKKMIKVINGEAEAVKKAEKDKSAAILKLQAISDANNLKFEKDSKDLTKFIDAQNKKQVAHKKGSLEEELLAIDNKYAAELKKAENHAVQLAQLEALKQGEKDAAKLQAELDFAQKEQDLKNEIELNKATTDEERAMIKAQQDFDKQALALEQLQLNSDQKTELLTLLTTNEELVVANIRDEFRKKENEALLKSFKVIEGAEKKQAKTREQIANILEGTLIGILGKSLAARLAGVAIEGAIQAGLIAISGAQAEAKISANTGIAVLKSVAASPLTFGLPFSAVAEATGAAEILKVAASTKLGIAHVLGATALKGLGTLVGGKFADGGQIPTLRSGVINNGANVTPLSNGDDTLAYVGQGEVILNKEDQARAGGNAFFNSIGVPGFADSGLVGTSSTVTNSITNNGINNEAFEILIEKINGIKVVAIESEITDAQISKAEIISGAIV